MKKTLFSIIISIGIFFNAQAQRDPKAGFQIKFPDQSAKSFFALHPDLDRIVVKYKNDKAVALDLLYQRGAGKYRYELLDLTFEGDRYLLDKKYQNIPFPKPGKLTMEYLAGVGKLSERNPGYDASITLHHDSIIHHFSFFTSPGNNLSRPVQDLHRARLIGGVSPLQKKLEQNFKQWKPVTVVDSALLIYGIVHENGSLEKLTLEIGEPSQFSKNVLEFIGQEATAWQPAWQNRDVKYRVKFFVRLNRDESITFSVL